MTRVTIIGRPDFSGIFKGGLIKIGNGLISINPEDATVKINPTLLMDNAAKLSATHLYEAMVTNEVQEADSKIDIPMFVDSITFGSDKEGVPVALTAKMDQLYINRPPFRGELRFWKSFSKYWNLCCLRAQFEAIRRKDQLTFFENQKAEAFQKDISALPSVLV